jgi:hypothetical protein
MSAVQALGVARAFGIHVEADGDDLLLEASGPPPDAVLAALSQHKPEVLRLLYSAKDGSSPEYWCVLFHQRAAVAEIDGRLRRTDAEARAFECCVVEWLNRNPTPSGAGRCSWCGQPGTQGAVVVPYGTEAGTHAWLHPECWPAWHELRRSQAQQALTRMGLGCSQTSAEQTVKGRKMTKESDVEEWLSIRAGIACGPYLSSAFAGDAGARIATPALPNPRHEAFAQALARGSSAAAAYVEAGYKANRHNAATLARKPTHFNPSG